MLRALLLLAALALRAPCGPTIPPPPGEASEYGVRAALILAFARIAEWPARALPASPDFVIGVMGEDPFGSHLEAFRGLQVKGRRVVVQHFRTPADYRPCQVLYFPTASERFLDPLRERLNADSVLTIGEGEGFPRRGGALRFLQEGGRIRYVVNRQALEHAGLRMPAKVLSLAKEVL